MKFFGDLHQKWNDLPSKAKIFSVVLPLFILLAIVGVLTRDTEHPVTPPVTPPVTTPVTTPVAPVTPPVAPVVTSEITFTYDGGTHPVFNLIAEQGYDRDDLRRIIIDYLNGHPDKATLCGTANCNINNLH